MGFQVCGSFDQELYVQVSLLKARLCHSSMMSSVVLLIIRSFRSVPIFRTNAVCAYADGFEASSKDRMCSRLDQSLQAERRNNEPTIGKASEPKWSCGCIVYGLVGQTQICQIIRICCCCNKIPYFRRKQYSSRHLWLFQCWRREYRISRKYKKTAGKSERGVSMSSAKCSTGAASYNHRMDTKKIPDQRTKQVMRGLSCFATLHKVKSPLTNVASSNIRQRPRGHALIIEYVKASKKRKTCGS